MTSRWKSVSVLLVFAMAFAPTAYTSLVTIDAAHVHAIQAGFAETGVTTPARAHVASARVTDSVHGATVPPAATPMSLPVALWAAAGIASDAGCSWSCAPSRPRSPPRS